MLVQGCVTQQWVLVPFGSIFGFEPQICIKLVQLLRKKALKKNSHQLHNYFPAHKEMKQMPEVNERAMKWSPWEDEIKNERVTTNE